MLCSHLATLAALAALAVPYAAGAQPMYTQGNRPVMIGSPEEGLDPCSLGMINDPPTGPDGGAVMVLPGDSTDLDYVDTVVHGQSVWVCEASGEPGEDEMLGIVYSHDPDQDCELSSPVDEPRAYVGPCSWGWVRAEWVEIVAG
ncbi:MAG: hypothetical protein KAF27_07850 [Porphyrobacter sp.]|nr:hypothetical protein [Porphyrobacter sp.]